MKSKIFFAIAFLLFAFSASAQMKKWTLQECVEYAVENNITVKQFELDLENAKIDKSDALGAFLPNLNGSATLSASTGLSTNPTTGTLQNQTLTSISLGLSSGVTLFDGLRNFHQLNRAKVTAVANQYRLDDMKDNIMLNVANSYLQILFNRENLGVQQSQYDVTKKEMERTKELVDNGVVPNGDLLEIQATAAGQEQQIIQAENALLISKIALAQLLQITDYENFDVADDEYLIPPSDIMTKTPKQIFEKAMSFRNDIKFSESNVELASKDLEIAKGRVYPTLSAFFNYNTRYADNIPLNFVDQLWFFDGISYGLQLNVPIFNGFSTRNGIQRSKISLERAKLQLDQDKLTLESNINQAFNDTKGALKSYEAAEKTLVARREAYKYSQERFNVGLMNSFDYSQAQQRMEAAESDVIRTKYDYIFKLKVLEFYFGIPLTAN